MDEDELADLRDQSLQAHTNYDTFGSTAAEFAHKAAASDAHSRPSVPNLIPDELIAPVADSIGECSAMGCLCFCFPNFEASLNLPSASLKLKHLQPWAHGMSAITSALDMLPPRIIRPLGR